MHRDWVVSSICTVNASKRENDRAQLWRGRDINTREARTNHIHRYKHTLLRDILLKENKKEKFNPNSPFLPDMRSEIWTERLRGKWGVVIHTKLSASMRINAENLHISTAIGYLPI